MCSVNEDNLAALEVTESAKLPKLSFKDADCRKCQTCKAQVLLRKTDPYCSDCFMKYAIHKFRSTLGKARAIKLNEKVLMAYSGGLSSGAMVSFVKLGMELAESQKALLVFKPALFHIDEGEILNLSNEEREKNTKSVLEYAKQCGLDVYFCGIEYSLISSADQLQLQQNSYQIQNSNLNDKLKTLIDSVKSLTAKEDLLLRLRQRLITLAALHLHHTKVFLGATATRLAGQLLAAVASGRGAQIADEIGFSDNRSGLVILRPMREFVDKEVAYVAHFLNVPSTCNTTLTSKLSATASIGRLTEEFVVNLQADFPGTISTLFRISDKLKANTNAAEGDSPTDDRCIICHSEIEQTPPNGAQKAREISQTISRSGPTKYGVDSRNCGKISTDCDSSSCASLKGCCKEAKAAPSCSDWVAALCYGCRVTVEDVKQLDLMPQSMQEDIRQRLRRNKIRESVEDFLL